MKTDLNKLPDNFIAKFDIDNQGCWNWTACKSRGYGRFGSTKSNKGKSHRAHRYAYQTIIGEIPEGLVLDHLCRNPGCVNPQHLEPVTQKENIRRGDTGKYQQRKE